MTVQITREGATREQKAELIVVTGASSGIGRAAAIAFASRGDNVILGGRDASKLDAVTREIGTSKREAAREAE